VDTLTVPGKRPGLTADWQADTMVLNLNFIAIADKIFEFFLAFDKGSYNNIIAILMHFSG